MNGTPENTVILHWDECRATWHQLAWRDWVRFRRSDDGGHSVLVGAEAGEHYFLVCVLGDRGELANVIPHRYLLSANGRLVHDFDGLGQSEREEYYSIQVLHSHRTRSLGFPHPHLIRCDSPHNKQPIMDCPFLPCCGASL